MKTITCVAATLVLLLAHVQSSNAGILIRIQDDVQLQAGGSGTVDVFISSDTNEVLDAAQYKFAISSGGASSTLSFPSQDVSEGFDPLAATLDTFDPSYVFFNNSAAGLFESSNTGSTVTHFDSVDFFFGASPVQLDLTEKLLVRLDITHSGAITSPETFAISLVDDADTRFTSDAILAQGSFDLFGLHATPAASATVTINPATSTGVVPEPTSAAIFAVGLVSVCGIRRRRRT